MFFQCNNGLGQGENLSPVLFSLFLNDLEHCLSKNDSICLNLFDSDLRSFLKIIILLYADDTVLFAESEKEMQLLLNEFSSYCKTWKLTINNNKTKLLVFGHRGRRNCNIYLNETLLEMVEAYKYLGVMFSKTRSFERTKKHVVEQARKALFSLYQNIRNLDLPIDCQVKLFDNTVLPILTYTCEVWGFGDLSVIVKVQTDFFKHILHVKNSTPHMMLYGELGRFPISLIIKQRMIKFWGKLVTDTHGKLSSTRYSLLYNDMSHDFCIYSWLRCIKEILDSVGLTYVWHEQSTFDINSDWLSKTVREILEAQFKQQWHGYVQESSKCFNYRMYKSEHKFENYLTFLPVKLMKHFINFRLCNNKLPIETGRWQNIDRALRKCNLCNDDDLGDGFHYIYRCSFFDERRRNIAPFIKKKKRTASSFAFHNLFNELNQSKLRKTCKFLGIILNQFRTVPGQDNTIYIHIYQNIQSFLVRMCNVYICILFCF